METYKIGNKVNCIIRSYCAGDIGVYHMDYANQPYTVIRNVSAEVSFASKNREANNNNARQLFYNMDVPTKLTISNVLLNDKILNLIYQKNEEKLCHKVENYISDESGTIYLNTPSEEIYQLFVYDRNFTLVFAEGTYSQDIISHLRPNEEFLLVYSYLGSKSYSLSKPENLYVTIDLEFLGNEDDDTQSMFLHLSKCGIKVDKSMYFTNTANTVDLEFNIINNDNNYITLK